MSYIDHKDRWGHVTHSWRQQTRRRLEWQYGPQRAADIMAGIDPKTERDIDAWENLGKPKGRAA